MNTSKLNTDTLHNLYCMAEQNAGILNRVLTWFALLSRTKQLLLKAMISIYKPRGVESTPMYGLYRLVLQDRVPYYKQVIIFAPFGKVFLGWSLDRLPILYQLKLQCVNAQLKKKGMFLQVKVSTKVLDLCSKHVQHTWLAVFFFWMPWPKKVISFFFLHQGLRTYTAHTYLKFTGVPLPPPPPPRAYMITQRWFAC